MATETLASVLAGIKQHESGGDYTAKSSSSSASGAYQYIDSTWNHYGGYAHAWQAPAAVQDARASADLSANLKKYGGDWRKVVAAHFAGGHWVDQHPDPATWDQNPAPGTNNPTVAQYVASVFSKAGKMSTDSTGTPNPSSPAKPPAGDSLGLGQTAPLTTQFDPNTSVSIKQYGFIASLAHTVPDLKLLMEKYAGQDLSSTAVQARLEADIKNTGWFKTTTDKQRAVQVERAENPRQYAKDFQDTQQKISTAAATLGVSLPGIQSHDFAANAMNMGWSDAEIRTHLLAEGVKNTAGSGTPGLLQTTESDLRQAAQTYMVPLSPAAYAKWTADIAAGRVTPADFETYLKEQAKSLIPSMGAAIDRGITPAQYLDPYRTYAATILEKDPASIDFLHDPKFGKAVFQIDPKTNERTAMSLADWQTYLRGLPEYKQTAQAKDQAAQFAEHIATTFGKVA